MKKVAALFFLCFLIIINFNEYFDENVKIISFYIFNKKYNCIYGTNRYLFRFNDLNYNIEGYKSFYNKLYNTNSYEYFKGYPISIVEVDIDTKLINKILNKNKNIKYSNEIYGNYHY